MLDALGNIAFESLADVVAHSVLVGVGVEAEDQLACVAVPKLLRSLARRQVQLWDQVGGGEVAQFTQVGNAGAVPAAFATEKRPPCYSFATAPLGTPVIACRAMSPEIAAKKGDWREMSPRVAMRHGRPEDGRGWVRTSDPSRVKRVLFL